MDKIIDNLYIGNVFEAISLLKDRGNFGAMLSIGTEFIDDPLYSPYFICDKNFPHMILQLDDRSKNIREFIDAGVKFTEANIDKCCFVHCAAGVSRSPSMVFAYLVNKGMKPLKAFELLTSTRTVACPHNIFIRDILRHYGFKDNDIGGIMYYIKSGVSY